jgi:aryl-alcohol dehydrogenase-like predicted oxidoreductase
VRTRPLGDTTATVIGAGDVWLARSAKRGVDRGEVARTLGELIELGATIVDCADDVDSEQLVGETVRGLRARDRVVVATRVTAQPSAAALGRTVQARVEASLRATRLDALPLAVLAPRAAWRDTSAWPELAGACARLVRDGKVLRWGATVDPEDFAAGGEPWLAEPWLVALQVAMSLCDRRALKLADELAKTRAVLVASPLAGGALAGGLGPGVHFALHDDRHAISAETLARISAGVADLARYVREIPAAARASDAGKARLERLVRVEPVECDSVADLALRWAVDRPGGVEAIDRPSAIALPRLHRGHVAAAVKAAAARPLSRDLLAQLDEVDI